MKHLRLFLFFFLISLACIAQDNEHGKNDILRLLEAGEFDLAIPLLENAVGTAPSELELARIYNAIGWAHFSSRRLAQARSSLIVAKGHADNQEDKAIKQVVYNNLGILEFTEGNLSQARNYFTSRWAVGSDTATSYLRQINDREESIAVDSFIKKGISHRLQNMFREAMAEYEKALQLDPNNPRALEYVGYAHLRLENPDAAIEFLNRAANEPGANRTIYYNLIKAYCKLSDNEAAARVVVEHEELMRAYRHEILEDAEFSKYCGASFISDLFAN